MTAQKTTAGVTHFAQRIANASLTNAFDAIELGSGNTSISSADTRNAMLNKLSGTLVQKESGYPKLNDSDVANVGRGADVWTYKFIIPSGVSPFTATNFHLTNYQSGTPSATTSTPP